MLSFLTVRSPFDTLAAKKRLIAVGAVCATAIYRVAAIPPVPAKALAHDACRIVDGMAISAACAFAKLGGDAAVWARIGDDRQGGEMRTALAAEGLDTSGLHAIAGGQSSHASVIVDARGDRLVVPYHDPTLDASPGWLPLEALKSADFLHCDVRWVEGAEAALGAARALGLPAMVDADVGPQAILRRLVPLATHAVFSDAGLFAYTGLGAVEPALRQVATEQRGHVGASCGADGYFWLEDGALRHVPAPKVDVVDTLSAGDVFHGALALALAEGKPMERAARFAAVAASLKCTRFGGRLGCPTREEVDAFDAG
jgi:sulfofructose kinase